LLINALAPGGSAEGLGLQPGQVLLQYAETKLTTIDDLKAAVQKAAGAGDKNAFVTVWKLDDKDQPSESIVAFPVGPLGVILAPEPAPVAIDSRRKNETLLAGLRGGENWKDLPGTRYEVQQLRSLFPTATVLLDGEANEAAVDAMRQTGKLGQFRFLHFATHGKGNSIAAFESKLILSQDQVKGEIKPGEPWYNNEVSAQEVLDYWKLNADLVTLSACQTGLGRQGGGEGLLGFAQAFLLSGARSVCLSLWEVDDIATALLMQRFYQNLRGEREGLMSPMPKAKALAEAKQWLRNLSAKDATTLTAKLTGGIARGNRGSKVFKLPEPTVLEEEVVDDDYKPFARPHYWSAFILIGDPE
jgi:CHAT domain-containing protein